ncbi:MAG: hypothetical protein OIN66_15590 [Candidatus Methanoperedens sp.]|nr:hypothetical protein [Candidatus Methanoperedens sp.]
MDKERIARVAKISIVLLLVLSVSGYYIYQHAMSIGLMKPALVLKVSTNITNNGDPMINNVTFEQSGVPFFYKRTDTEPKFPEIQVEARLNKLASAPASYWSSAHYYYDDGVYTLQVFFRDGSEPKQGDVLILPIRIISYSGAVAYKTTAFWIWE